MTFFPLPYLATVKKKAAIVNEVTDRSGQTIETCAKDSIVVNPAVACLFILGKGTEIYSGFSSVQGAMTLHCEPNIDIEEGYYVQDIRTKTGEVIEAGPFEVDTVRKVPGLTGKVHHKTCILVGVIE